MHRIPVQIHLDIDTHRALADTAAVKGHTLAATAADLLRTAVRAKANTDADSQRLLHPQPAEIGPAPRVAALRAIA